MNIYNKSWFNTYLEKAGEKSALVNAFTKRAEQLDGVKSILDIGTHDGTLLSKLLSHPASRFSLEQIVGIDPADVSQKFFQQIHSFASDTQFYQANAEQFLSPQMPVYDIILASQCLYWSDDLSGLVSLINSKSRAACIVLRGQRGIYEIQSHFKALIGNKDEKFYTSADIENSLDGNHIPHAKQTYLSEISMPEKHTEHWYGMLSFFLQTDIARLSTSDSMKVEAFIEDLMSDNRTIFHQVEFFWLGEWQ